MSKNTLLSLFYAMILSFMDNALGLYEIRSTVMKGFLRSSFALCIGFFIISCQNPSGSSLSGTKSITAFSFPGLAATISIDDSAKAIEVQLPSGTDRRALVATFMTSGVSVRVGSVVQVSGTTANDFTASVTYEVFAADGTSVAYTVTVSVEPSASKAISAFSFAIPLATCSIDETAKTIAVTVPYGTPLSALVASYQTSGASVKVSSVIQTSGVTPNDFSQPLRYEVVAADGTSAFYAVTVTLASNDAKTLKAFSFASPDASGTIDESAKTIAISVPFGATVSALVATFETTGASVLVGSLVQTTGVSANDFSRPVSYEVRAANGTSVFYTVTVTVAPSGAKQIKAFSILDPQAVGTIDETAMTIAVGLPYGTAVSALVASFETTGSSATVGSVVQVSGTTPNDFSAPLKYHVLAADGTEAVYTVTVTVDSAPPSSAKAILSFSFLAADNPGLGADAVGAVRENPKYVEALLPAGTISTALKPRIEVSAGATISPASLGATNFAHTVVYTVKAEDGSEQDYSVAAVTSPVSPEMIANGDFCYSYGDSSKGGAALWSYWQKNGAASIIDCSSGSFVLSGSPRGPNKSSIFLGQKIPLDKNGIYQLRFDASSSNSADKISVYFQESGLDVNNDGNAWTPWTSQDFSLSAVSTTYSATLVMQGYDDPKGYLDFQLGTTAGTVCIDNVSLQKIGTFTTPAAPEMVWNGDFSVGSGYWMSYQDSTCTGATTDFSGGAFDLGGTNRGSGYWAYQLETTKSLSLEKNTVYKLSLNASSTISTDLIHAAIREAGTDIDSDGDIYTCWDSVDYTVNVNSTQVAKKYPTPRICRIS
jgi:hypothetical protein